MKKTLLLFALLLLAYSLVAQESAIRVISPNGGENWTVGSTHNITWSTAILSGNVMIQLRRGGGNIEYITIASNVPISNQSYTWTIPTTVASGSEYKVRIVKVENNTLGVQDYSNGFFTVSNSTPPPSTLTVTSPNGGENWQIGTTHNITWSTPILSGYVTIQLRRGGINQEYVTVATNVPVSNGSYSWSIPSTIATGNEYKIRIVKVENNTPGIEDYSNSFFHITTSQNMNK